MTRVRIAALLAATALCGLAACDDSASSRQASSDLKQAGDKAEAGFDKLGSAAKTQLDVAADKAGPALDRIGDKTQEAADKLASATGRAARKAGDSLERAGDKAQAKAAGDKARHEGETARP